MTSVEVVRCDFESAWRLTFNVIVDPRYADHLLLLQNLVFLDGANHVRALLHMR